MMARSYSPDLKWRIVYLHMEGYSLEKIARLLHISKSTVNRVLKIHRRWCCVEDPLKGQPGRRKLFSGRDLEVFTY
jgi:transposase-like protein